jgi:hypothetical protein
MSQQFPDDPKAALRTIRLLWAAMLVGQILFMIVIAVMHIQRDGETSQISKLLGYVGFGMLPVMTAVGYFIRNQTYKANWREDVITPQGYGGGNLILLAMLEGVALLSLVATLLHGSFGLPFVPAMIAMAIQVINYPNGRAMYPPDHLADP